MDEDFAASVGGDTALDERQYHLESSLERREPGRLEYRRDGVAVERTAQLLRQRAALQCQQVVVRRLAQSTALQPRARFTKYPTIYRKIICLQCFDSVGRQEGHPACKN